MLIPLSCAVLLFSYRLNVPHGGFVDMAVSDHGQAAPFLVSALSGILFVLALAGLLPSSRIFSFVGRNTLIYLGFNGLFFHFLNAAIVKWWLAQYGLTNITLFCSAVTILSMLLCVPFAFVANRFIPQLVGRIDRVGPILPALGESQTKPPEKHRGIMARSLGPKGVSTEPRGYS